MIVGQNKLKRQVDRIFKIFNKSKGEIKPHFFLTGATGTGKSFVINTLSKRHGIDFIKINGAALTKEGTSGNSVSKALSPLLTKTKIGKPILIFVDEFDKLLISGNTNSELAHETTNGVQNEFLTLLENDKASVFGEYGKYLDVDVSKCLFCFAGAFNGQENIKQRDLLSMGVKTEFLGRVNLIYNTMKLSLDTLYEILNNAPLLDAYLIIFDSNKTSVINDLKPIIKGYYHKNIIGARMVNSIIHKYFIEGIDFLKEELAEQIHYVDIDTDINTIDTIDTGKLDYLENDLQLQHEKNFIDEINKDITI